MKRKTRFLTNIQTVAHKTLQKARKYSIANNLLIGFLVICVGFACLFPTTTELTVGGMEDKIFRHGVSKDGVSLMFNVYSDTQSVEEILAVLENHNAKATFFIGGCWADDNVEVLRKIKGAGHELANHGYFHKDHPSLTKEQNKQEISLCNEFIYNAVATKMTLFAPPSGAYDKTTVEMAETLGMKTILWSRDTIDWRDKDVSVVYTRATKNITCGEFVLMHPTPHTAKALPDVLKYYESCKLRAITVSENLQQGG